MSGLCISLDGIVLFFAIVGGTMIATRIVTALLDWLKSFDSGRDADA